MIGSNTLTDARPMPENNLTRRWKMNAQGRRTIDHAALAILQSDWESDIRVDAIYHLMVCRKLITGEPFTFSERWFFWMHRLTKVWRRKWI